MMTSRRTRSAQAVTQNVGAAHSALPGPGRPGERTREAAAGPRLPGSSVGPRAAHPGSRGRRPALSAVLRQALGVVPELKRRYRIRLENKNKHYTYQYTFWNANYLKLTTLLFR
nr:uncharacterized protein LOC108396630 [Manis javanica]